MLKKWFGKGKEVAEEVFVAPLQGQLVPLSEVPDPVFAEKMMGEGVAIVPVEGRVVSPVVGEVVVVFPTKHAVGIRTASQLEVLIHIGLETVQMQGEGFTSYVQVGDRVSVGQPLIDFSLELVREKAKSIVTPIIITNSEKVQAFHAEEPQEIKIGQSVIFRVVRKG